MMLKISLMIQLTDGNNNNLLIFQLMIDWVNSDMNLRKNMKKANIELILYNYL